MNQIMSFLLGIVFLSSCTYDVATPKQPTSPVDMEQIWTCTDSQHLDSAKLAKLLVGQWKWTYGGYEEWTPANKNVTITFDSLGNYSLQEDTMVTTGIWSLFLTDNPYFGIALSKGNNYCPGQILICDDQLLFDDDYIDGPNDLFIRAH